MGALANLLALYSGIVVINVIMSGLLWARQRHPLYRRLFYIWAAFVVSFITQGAAAKGAFVITVGFSFVFLINVGLAELLSSIAVMETRIRPFVLMLGGAILLSAVTNLLGLPFWTVALPVNLAVAAPLLYTAFEPSFIEENS